jgi:hypothetical protein
MPQPDPPDDHAAGDYRDQYQELTGAAVPRQAESFHIAYCVRLSQRTESMTPTQIAKPLTRSAMRRVIFPVIAGLWGYPVAADAYSLRTSDGLLSVCTDQHEDMKAYCRGYIDAVVEYLVIERLGQKHPVCIPNNVPTTTIENAVINFMKSQSDARSAFSPGLIITMAIDITWPCNSTK